jgi:putative Ca2+/H+ antiporter (TMEM165/GDT1 family)
VSILLLRIFGPQLLGLLAYFVLRRRVLLAQLAAVLTTTLAAAYAGHVLPTLPRIGAFLALEVFVALLAQLLIAGADEDA